MNRKTILPLSIIILSMASCQRNEKKYDASGAFEAEETIISAESAGTIVKLEIEEGQALEAGQAIGYIDSIQLFLKKKQVEEQIKAVLSRRPDIPAQIAGLREQLKNAEKEQQRISNLVKADAIPQKQMDDVNAQIELLKKQLEAQQSVLGITSQSITNETSPLEVQIEQLNDQLSKCRIKNPLKGTVLTKYAEEKEVTAPGKPLYKIADLSSLILRAYITGSQLSDVALNREVAVLVDDGPENYREYKGIITWISSKAEFTPKTIQTKEERANLVYPVKIKVENDGPLKIGMYGEVKF